MKKEKKEIFDKNKQSEIEFPIIFHHAPEGPTREYRLEQLNEILQKYANKINKRDPVERIEVTIEQPKNPVGKITGYGVRLHIFLFCGESYVASAGSFVARAQHLGLEKNIREAGKEIILQIEKHRSKQIGHN
ncbi:MAG: hypothetical protein Q7S57_00565 [bacterium]|nr:hypothetical protein [bacterium]